MKAARCWIRQGFGRLVASSAASFVLQCWLFPFESQDSLCILNMTTKMSPLRLTLRTRKVSPVDLKTAWSGSQSARSVFTSRSKHSLLSPVQRSPRQLPMKGRLLRISTQTERQRKPIEYADVRKGFQLFRRLFVPAPVPHPLTPPVPEPVPQRPAPVEKPKPTYHLKVSEPDTSSLSRLLDIDSGLQTPRRRSLLVPELPVVEKGRQEAVPITVEPVLTPVLRIQEIDASELSSSSEESFHFMPSRRSSKANSIYRRGSTFLPASPQPPSRRLTMASDTKASLMTDYNQKTASMLADTQFRIKGFKTQRAIPMRYFKNLQG